MNLNIRDIRDVSKKIAEDAYKATTKEFKEFPESTKIRTLVATIGDKLCAAGSLGSNDLTYGSYSDKGPWIADLWVHPDFRGEGVAKILVADLLEIARNLGYDVVYMWTYDQRLRNYLQTFAKCQAEREYFGHTIYIFSIIIE